MCGICGIISNRIAKDVRDMQVREMNACIANRGPDEDGFFSDGNCTLAMRRLAIIDLFNGRQPLYSTDKKSLIFFNGEIYNYRELKEELLAEGVVFYTQSDTEVIISLFNRFGGPQAVTKLKGMF